MHDRSSETLSLQSHHKLVFSVACEDGLISVNKVWQNTCSCSDFIDAYKQNHAGLRNDQTSHLELSSFLSGMPRHSPLSSQNLKPASSAYWFIVFFLLFLSDPWQICLCFCSVCVCVCVQVVCAVACNFCVCVVCMCAFEMNVLICFCKRPGLSRDGAP